MGLPARINAYSGFRSLSVDAGEAIRSTKRLRRDIIDLNMEVLSSRSVDDEPRYPQVRSVWSQRGKIPVFMASFSHNTTNITSGMLGGNEIVASILATGGFNGERALVTAYDWNIPHKDDPQGNMLDFPYPGKKDRVPILKKPNVPCAFQNAHADFSMRSFRNHAMRFLSQYGSNLPRGGEEKIDQLVSILGQYASSQGSVTDAVLETRRAFMRLFGVELTEEVALSSLRGQLADSLETLDSWYGKPFYTAPLPPKQSGTDHPCYVIAIDSTGQRRPTDFDGTYFIYKDSYGAVHRVHRRDVYAGIRDGSLILPVAMKILADTLAPQIPHMGANHHLIYADSIYRLYGKWLGISDADIERLYLCTVGLRPYDVSVRVDGEVKVFRGPFVAHLSFDKEQLKEAVRGGEYIGVDLT